ncbi:MAG: hypothetical protein U0Q11_05955 [Vicinamibacterales bacterium]
MGVLVTGMLAAGEHGEVIRFGALGVLNNQWGAELGHAAPQSFQRVRVDGSRVVFEFDWKNKSPEDSVWVKAYPAIVAGWHYGVPVYPGDASAGNLPQRVSSGLRLRTSLRATRTGAAETDAMNLAWDIWLTASKPDPLATTPVLPAAEVMVWPWRQQQWPMTLEGSNSKACSLKPADQIGAKPIVVGATLWQRSWDVYLGCASSGDTVWPVLSFVPQQPLVNDAGVVVANGQLGDFLAYASSNLRSWTQWDPSWWVAGVEFGSEIIEGSGSWTIEQYRIEP